VLDVKIKDLPHPRRQQAGGDDPQLRRHPPRAFRAGRLRPALLDPPSLDLWPDVHWAPDYNKSAAWTWTR
jgi:fumarate hydratase, class I